MKGWGKQTKGFTLVELLVVIAIIAILMTILLPALVGGTWKAKKFACSKNLSELHRYMVIEYTTQNHDAYPPATGAAFWEVLRTKPTPEESVMGDLPPEKIHRIFKCPVVGGVGGFGDCDYRGPSYRVTGATKAKKPLGADKVGNHGEKEYILLYFSGDIKEVKPEGGKEPPEITSSLTN